MEQRTANKLSTKYEGPPGIRTMPVLTCDEPIQGTNVILSYYVTRDPPDALEDVLNMEEIILIGLKNK